jgi:predicted DNA-binding transcriptional regulator AlpA
MSNSPAKLVPKRAVADAFGVSTKTIDRWIHNPVVAFPKPITINTRSYWPPEALDAFRAERREAAK